jgi:acyl-CoA thioesterase FadM
VSLWKSGRLGLFPGLTARLEVDYKKKLPADTLIICSTELESIDRRKVWMKARVYDAMTGQECAQAKALFVAPRLSSVLRSMLPFGIGKKQQSL